LSFFEELKRRNVVRVGLAYVLIAWLLLQGADFALDLIGAPNWVIQALSLLAAIGLPGVLVFSWVFEMTPEGLRRETDVDRSQSITTQTGRKLDRVIVAVLSVAVAYLLADKLVLQDRAAPVTEGTTAQQPEPVAEKVGPSVAVLPFVNMSGDTENEYFSDGLTETLLHMLAQLPELRVAARTSSFAFKGQNISIGEIAAALGVAHILEGSVQKAGDRVRITAQLIKADDGFHVWSETYDRTLDDIFAIQDEIAADVAGALDASLLGSAEQRIHGVETRNLGAYDTYLRAMEQQAIYSYGSLTAADSLFKQALAADPDFIDAKLGLARNHLMMQATGLTDDPTMRARIAPLLEQVRGAQPDNRLARAFELMIELQATQILGKEEWDRLITELRNLLPLIPTESYIRSWVASQLAFFHRQPEQGLEVLEAGLLVDPLSAYLHSRSGDIFRELDRFEDARRSYMRAIELDPRLAGSYTRLSRLAREENDIRGRLDWLRQATEADPQDHELAALLAEELYDLKLPEEGDRWAARVNALAPESDVARRVELLRALARNEPQRVIGLAEDMIADQVSMRGDSFATAAFVYAEEMSRMGRFEEGYEFLMGVRPELADYEQMPSDVQGLIMQWNGVILMTGFRTFEERQAAWLALTANMNATGFPWREIDPDNRVQDLIFRGQLEEAIRVALEEDLSRPLAIGTWRLDAYRTPLFADVVQDPAVAARLAELDREFNAMREGVLTMLEQPEWAE